MKFKQKKFTYKIFGKLLYHIISTDMKINFPNTQIILAPTPIHIYTRLMRGYNQTDLLCREIIKHDTQNLFIYTPKAIRKNKITKSQKHLVGKEKRLHNLQNSFSVRNPAKISKEIIVIIDDVWTTGATLSEITGILYKAGAEKVFCYVIAH